MSGAEALIDPSAGPPPGPGRVGARLPRIDPASAATLNAEGGVVNVSQKLAEFRRNQDNLGNKEIPAKAEDVQAMRDRVNAPPPVPQNTPVEQQWGSAAMVVAALGGLFTRSHAATALNAMAGVLQANKKGDTEDYQRAYANWKANHDALMVDLKWQEQQLMKLQDRYARGNDPRAVAAEVGAFAAATRNTAIAEAINGGNLPLAMQIAGGLTTGIQSMQAHADAVPPEFTPHAPLLDAHPAAVAAPQQPSAAAVPGGMPPAEGQAGAPAAAPVAQQTQPAGPAPAEAPGQPATAPAPTATATDAGERPMFKSADMIAPYLAGMRHNAQTAKTRADRDAITRGATEVQRLLRANPRATQEEVLDAYAVGEAGDKAEGQPQQIEVQGEDGKPTKVVATYNRLTKRWTDTATGKPLSTDGGVLQIGKMPAVQKPLSAAERAGRNADILAAEKWEQQHGKPPTDADKQSPEFVRLTQQEVVDQKASMAKVTAEAAQLAREKPMLSADAIRSQAQIYLVTGALPGFGIGGAGDKAAIIEEANRLAKEQGLTVEDITSHRAQYKADDRSLPFITKQFDAIDAYEKSAIGELELARKAAPKEDVVLDSQWMQAWVRGGQKQFGNTDIAKFHTYLVSALDEYAKVLSGATGAAGTSDAARAQALEIIPPGATSAQIPEIIDAMKDGMALKTMYYRDQMRAIRERIASPIDHVADEPRAPVPGAARAAPPAALQQLKANPSPEMQQHFDEVFGPGAAKKAIGQ